MQATDWILHLLLGSSGRAECREGPKESVPPSCSRPASGLPTGAHDSQSCAPVRFSTQWPEMQKQSKDRQMLLPRSKDF